MHKRKRTQERVWTLIQEQGLFCQDALLGPNWILSHDVRWHHWETSRGHVRRKWLQLLTNVKLMRVGGSCWPEWDPHQDNYTVNGLQLDADGAKALDSGGTWVCLNNMGAAIIIPTVEALDRCMLASKHVYKCACRRIRMHILQGSKHSQKSAQKLISVANI